MASDDHTSTGHDADDRWVPLSVDEVVTLMGPLGVRWWFTGGHALELHLGRSWRNHGDIDVGICRDDVRQLRPLLNDWRVVISAESRLEPWSGRELSATHHENNLRIGRVDGPWLLDVTVGDGGTDEWIYRRDPRLRLPWDRAVLRTTAGVPYLAPGLQLLFKSKEPRRQDHLDADAVIPMLDAWSLALLDVRLPRGHAWTAAVATHRRGVTGGDVLDLLAVFESAGVTVWVDGGWGVDALLGEQTRAHADLDVALPTSQWNWARQALADQGFVMVGDDGVYNVVLADPQGRLIDLHAFDDTSTVVGDDGIERHGPDGLDYVTGGFTGRGTIGGRRVRCMSAAFQMQSHTGYDVDKSDWRDVLGLHERFGLPIPADYRSWQDD